MIFRTKYFKLIDQVVNLKKSVFFTGSRQVGKTTLMKSYLESKKISYFYANFDEIFWFWIGDFKNVADFVDYLKMFYQNDFLEHNFIVFDEIIRVKNFNIILKALIDRYPEKIFFCSASGEYEIVENILEWLAGRIVKVNVYPLDFNEFLQFKNVKFIKCNSPLHFDLIKKYLLEYLRFGGYPEVVLNEDENAKKIILKSIVDSIFQKDLLKLVKEEKIFQLIKFVKLLRNNIWSLFSYEGFANKLGVKLNDLKVFINALERIQLVFLLNPFFTDKKIEISSKQKIYINDFGIYNFLVNNFDVELDGKFVEQFVFNQLKFNLWFFDELYFYRKLNESEIDFIYKNQDGLIPIEVKSDNSDNIPKIFKSFCEKYKKDINFFVKTSQCLEKERQIDDCKVWIMPYVEILNKISNTQ